jgi:hypothetical protein
MEPFCQFFAEPRDVVRAYLALDNTRLKEIAEGRLGCPIIRLDRFCEGPLNIFFWKDICIFWHNGFLYVYDESQNYIKFSLNLSIIEANIYDINGFNRLWDTIHKVFAELCAGELHVKKDNSTTYIWLGGDWALANLEGIAMYDGCEFVQAAPLALCK